LVFAESTQVGAAYLEMPPSLLGNIEVGDQTKLAVDGAQISHGVYGVSEATGALEADECEPTGQDR
jgi:hypothetical protein